jgi:hypothetical protein
MAQHLYLYQTLCWKVQPTTKEVCGSLPDECFLKAYKIKSVIPVHVLMVFKILACLVQEKTKYKVSACFSVTKTEPI